MIIEELNAKKKVKPICINQSSSDINKYQHEVLTTNDEPIKTNIIQGINQDNL